MYASSTCSPRFLHTNLTAATVSSDQEMNHLHDYQKGTLMHPSQSLRIARIFAGLFVLLMSVAPGATHAAEPFSPARIAVYFSPHGGATEAVVRELNAAQSQVLMQAYSFTSSPIAKALVEAHKRGVKVLAVLDTSNETGKYSAATFLHNAGIQPLIDDQHAIAHSKVMVIDSMTLITGSFNFTKAAEEKNAENMLVITDAPELVQAYEANIRMGCDRPSSEALCRERQPHFLKRVDWFDELAIRIQPLGFLLDAIRHEVVPIPIKVDAAHGQHRLSTLDPPGACPSAPSGLSRNGDMPPR